MSETINVSGITKEKKYISLLPQLKALVEGESNIIANLGNIVAALKYEMDFFWVGVYFVEKKELILGPFQGPVACTRIGYGKGVCGRCWETKETIIVEDVDKFPGHIACSSESKSEVVLPVFNKVGDVQMVLDVDSEHLAYFNETDKLYLNKVVEIMNSFLN